MATNTSRSERASLQEGATDGKYRKVRPDTTVVDYLGDAQMRRNREALHPFNNWGFITEQADRMVNPGA